MVSQQQKESGIEIPNQQLHEFLRSVPPFDTLGSSELMRVISRMEMAYFPRGQRIKSKGDKSFEHLCIIQKGSARISLVDDEGQDLLVDVRGEGDYFGATSILQNKPAMFDITARQDLLCLMTELLQILKQNPVDIEAHIEGPQESDVFKKYPKILKDHDAIEMICVTIST